MIQGMLSIPPPSPAHTGKTPENSRRKATPEVASCQPEPGKKHHSGVSDRDRKRKRHIPPLRRFFRDIRDVLLMAVGRDDSDDYECMKG